MSRGCVAITASHNPPDYNGVKVFDRDGLEIEREAERKIELFARSENPRFCGPFDIGTLTDSVSWQYQYADALRRQVSSELRELHWRVVVDPGNGVGALVTPRILEEIGLEVVKINNEVDGRFPNRPPEPSPQNLRSLSMTVLDEKADLGVALDGDADRAVFIDEFGTYRWGDEILAALAEWQMSEGATRTVVTPVSTARMIDDVAGAWGGSVVRTKVGSLHVSRAMVRTGAILGGEDNGGIFYAPHMPTRDGTMTTILVLTMLAHRSCSLSEALGKLPKYTILKSHVACPRALHEKVTNALIQATSENEPDLTDGIRFDPDEETTVHLRPSGTEPIFRVSVESRDAKRAEDWNQFYLSLVEKTIRDS
jgi:phosphomannomutase/phosphoglucomutase